MTKNLVNNQFSEIRKVVYMIGGESIEVLYRSSTTQLSDIDFLETNFKFLQEKFKYSDKLVLNFLSKESILPDETSIDDVLDTLEERVVTLFPTLGSGERLGTKFFSSYISPGYELLVLVIPEEIDSVMMYDRLETPCITLGFDNGEKEFRKLLYLIINKEKKDNITLDLSYLSWEMDINGNQEMYKYVLRNDYLVSSYSASRENTAGFLMSEVSGSLLGTTKVENRPIYNLLSRIEDNRWNPSKSYRLGETAVIGGTEYESLEPRNIGNHPYYSRSWVKKRVI